MEFIRKYLATIRAQLMGLTISQKLLIGLLLLVMVATIFFTVTLSAKPEMVVLIPQSMTAEEINRVEMYLKGKHTYQIKGDSILVPAEKAYAIRGELFAVQALPKDTTAAFTTLVKENSLFETDANSGRKWNLAMQETLTKMLRYFPYIEDGTVIISRGEKAGIGREKIPSSASVAVKVRNNEGLSGSQVVAIVDMIRGSVPGLQREDVHITDGQRVYHAPSSDTMMPADLLAVKKMMEEDFTNKLWKMFGDTGNVKIAVNVIPDMSARIRKEEKYPGKITAIKSETTTETNTSDTSGGGAGGEPGVRPNVSATANDSASIKSRSTSTNNNSKSDYDNRFNSILENTNLPPGTEFKDITASISLPRSYFVAIYRSRIAKDPKADPDDATLQTSVIDGQIKIAQARAKNAIGVKLDEQIRIDWFDDMITLHNVEAAGVAGTFGSGGSFTTIFSQYAKQAILGIVALGVLGMMLMMVRRAVPSGAGGTDIDPSVFFGGTGATSGGGGSNSRPRRKGEPGALDVGEDVFGEAGEGEAVLTGIELDDETLQSRKMVDEVSTMIKENPENAAALVKRWISKNK